MPIEIERKFLVADDSWRAGVTEVLRLEDAIIARFDGGKVRVRHAGHRAWITVKGPKHGCTRAEFEYEIPVEDAAEMLAICNGPVVAKARHCVMFDGRAWSVDVYEGPLEGVTVAEVELSSASETFKVPHWIGREITHDPR